MSAIQNQYFWTNVSNSSDSNHASNSLKSTLGSKITLKGKGWLLMDSVNAHWSIGDSGSALILNDQKSRAVLRKTDLWKSFRLMLTEINQYSLRGGQVLTRTYSPSKPERIRFETTPQVSILLQPSLRIESFWIRKMCWITTNWPSIADYHCAFRNEISVLNMSLTSEFGFNNQQADRTQMISSVDLWASPPAVTGLHLKVSSTQAIVWGSLSWSINVGGLSIPTTSSNSSRTRACSCG